MGAAWRWLRDHPIWGVFGALLGIIGLALTAIQIWAPQWLHGAPVLAISDKGTAGPASVRVKGVECDKSFEDLSEGYRADSAKNAPEGQDPASFIQGDLCLARVEIRNDSNSQVQIPALWGTLLIQDGRYDNVGIDQADPPDPLTLFPGESQEVTYIFDVPDRTSPTGLEFAWTEPDNEESVTYAL
jgi:hypothetical protein